MTENRDVPKDLLNRLIQAVNANCNYPLNDNEQESLMSYKGYIYGNLKEQYNKFKNEGEDSSIIFEKLKKLLKMHCDNQRGGKNNKNTKKEETVKYLGGNYKVHTGPRGGKYIIHQKSKVYISN
jgi:hypothetical protein